MEAEPFREPVQVRAALNALTEQMNALLESVGDLVQISERSVHPLVQSKLAALPSLNESDLGSLELQDSDCPICYMSYHAIIATEETSLAMESPAISSAELGVTQLKDTCGHVFCRKDISKWISERNYKCPICRASIFTESERRDHPSLEGLGTAESNTRMLQSMSRILAASPEEALMREPPISPEQYNAMLDEAVSVVGRARDLFLLRRNLLVNTTEGERESGSARIESTAATAAEEGAAGEDTIATEREHNEPSNDRDEFSGMYS